MKANAKSIVRAKSLFLIIKDTAVSKISIIRLCVTGPRLTTECHKTKGLGPITTKETQSSQS